MKRSRHLRPPLPLFVSCHTAYEPGSPHLGNTASSPEPEQAVNEDWSRSLADAARENRGRVASPDAFNVAHLRRIAVRARFEAKANCMCPLLTTFWAYHSLKVLVCDDLCALLFIGFDRLPTTNDTPLQLRAATRMQPSSMHAMRGSLFSLLLMLLLLQLLLLLCLPLQLCNVVLAHTLAVCKFINKVDS